MSEYPWNKKNTTFSQLKPFYNPFNGRKKVLNAFERNIFHMNAMSDNGCEKNLSTPSKIPIRKPTHKKGIKILTPKQMLERLPIALAEVKAGNKSEHLLNEIYQIIHSLCQEKEIKKSHTCDEGGAYLKISVWHLMTNLKTNYLFKKKTIEVGQ